ncbi:MAG: esterase family protein [Oscillospiraceae bacterium]|nr:esterase family protein [Oscillospiraceae bacterium]
MEKPVALCLCLLLLAGCAASTLPGEPSPSPSEPTASPSPPDTPAQPSPSPSDPKDDVKGEVDLDAILQSFAAKTAEGFTPRAGFDKKQEGVAYGETAELEYYSNTTGATRKCIVYTPPGYDPSRTYPVLYLLHGIGGIHTEWLGGEPNNILSNLLAEGDAPPMIAVLPNIRAKQNDGVGGDIFGAESIAAFDNFINDLRDDLMPFIRENYSVSDKREETAVAGLSMGGREALFIAVSMPETFGFAGAFCPAPGLMSSNLGIPGQLDPSDMTLPEKYKRDMFILINAGNQDTVVGDSPLNYSGAFAANGVEHAYYSIDGGHGFDVWKNGLYWFAGCIFKRAESGN